MLRLFVGCKQGDQIMKTLSGDTRQDTFLYLFGCRLEWLRNHDIRAFEQLQRAAQSPDLCTQSLGQWFLRDLEEMAGPRR